MIGPSILRRVLATAPAARASTLVAADVTTEIEGTRKVYFSGIGFVDAAVHRFETLPVGETLAGPAIVESPFTTVVIDPGATAERRASGSLSIDPGSV